MPRPNQRQGATTANRILDVAEELAQQGGFNGFSYADIARELGITTASLHYHFPGKVELGKALISRYAERFFTALTHIDGQVLDAAAKLRAYAELYALVLRERRLCLCGMLAAEYNTLAQPMRSAVIQFFNDNEAWLTRVLREGLEAGSLRFSGPPEAAARMVVASLEGAMLVTRPYGDIARFQSAAEQLIAGLRVGAPAD
jgi:TetR/AcrR family transcriptional repressor of nem operon